MYHLGFHEARRARDVGVGIPEHAVGVAVIVAPDNTIVTVVRSHNRERLRTYGRR